MSKKKKSSKKSASKTGASKSLIILVLILIGTNIATLYYFLFVSPTIPTEDLVYEIGDITGDNAEQFIGQTLTVAGYLVIAGNYTLLVTNPQIFWNNTFSLLGQLEVNAESFDAMPYLGIQLEITGAFYHETAGVADHYAIEYQSHEVVSEDAMAFAGCHDRIVSASDLIDLPPLIDTTMDKYAVLYSGGIRPTRAYYRYWNDMVWMYWILRLFGYAEENIIVVYKDGIGENGQIPVHYNASHAAMDTVFANLSAEMGRADSLFFYVTNHGDYGGICGWEAIDDELMSQTDVTDWLDSITCNHMTIVMEQCVSGAFIPYLSAPNRIIMTACGDDESSWSCDDEGEWDEFVFHFMSALLQFRINGDGIPVWADITGDGEVSMSEAFGYAATMDSRNETPLYDDNGDGVASTVGNIIGTDGLYGNNIFL